MKSSSQVSTDPSVRQYLRRLSVALDRDEIPERASIVEDMREHIKQRLSLPGASVSVVLDQLGRPEDIAREWAAHDEGEAPRVSFLDRRVGAVMIGLLLTVGALVLPVFGWLVGVVLVIRSRSLQRIDKFVLVLVGPVGIGLFLALRALPIGSQGAECSGTGFCAPSLPFGGIQSVASLGPWVLVIDAVIVLVLLVRFRARRRAA